MSLRAGPKGSPPAKNCKGGAPSRISGFLRREARKPSLGEYNHLPVLRRVS
jgi:hypothetical protein